MGYRSDVAIKCGDKAYKMIMDAAMAHDVKPDVAYKCDEFDWIICWDSVKWYYSYEDVAAIESVLSCLDTKYEEDDSDGYAYTFARIGEDDEDTEIRTNCFNDVGLYINRSFSW